MDQADIDKLMERWKAIVAEEEAKRAKANAWLAPHLAAIRADPTAALLVLGVGFIAGKWGGFLVGLAGKLIG